MSIKRVTVVLGGDVVEIGPIDLTDELLNKVIAASTHATMNLVVPDNEDSRNLVRLLTGGWNSAEVAALNTRVDELELSVRTQNVLSAHYNGEEREPIVYLWQLLELTEADLLSRKSSGRKTLNEVKTFLARDAWGFELGSEAKVDRYRGLLKTE